MENQALRKFTDREVVVSLTSFPSAVPYIMPTLKSLLSGNIVPDRIVLYLTFSQFGGEAGIPEELKQLAKGNNVFEIRDYPREIRSYRKLVPALTDFPEAIIVTVDDDAAYHPDMLKRLLETHMQFPRDIIAHRAKHIKPGRPYKEWSKYRWYHSLKGTPPPSPLTIQTGVGGVLYPPHALDSEMINEDLFREIAPTADDIWFWAAAVSNGRNIVPVRFGFNKPKGTGKPSALSLKWVNFKRGEDRNALTFRKILEQFPKVRERIKNGK